MADSSNLEWMMKLTTLPPVQEFWNKFPDRYQELLMIHQQRLVLREAKKQSSQNLQQFESKAMQWEKNQLQPSSTPYNTMKAEFDRLFFEHTEVDRMITAVELQQLEWLEWLSSVNEWKELPMAKMFNVPDVLNQLIKDMRDTHCSPKKST